MLEDLLGPEVTGAVLLAVLSLVAFLQYSIKPEARWPNKLRRALFPRLDPWGRRLGRRLRGRPRPFVRRKREGGKDYVTTAHGSISNIARTLYNAGYRLNLLATLKFVVNHKDERRYERLSMVMRHPDDAKQTHVYAFFTLRGYHLHQHIETDYLEDPRGHETDRQTHGDPNHTLRDALDAAGIKHTKYEKPQYD